MRRSGRLLALALGAMTTGTGAQPLATGVPQDPGRVPGLEIFVEHSKGYVPFVRTETGAAFLDAVRSLPNQLRRYLWVDKQFTTAYTEAEYESLADTAKRPLNFRPVTEVAFYMAVSERPLVDVLAVDLAVRGTPMESPAGLAGKKVLLFNPRVITQGRLLASLGAHVTVVHDQQRMAALYSEPGDVGTIPGHDGAPDGSLRLVRAAWPGSEGSGEEEIGTGYDLVIVSDWVSHGLSLSTPVPPRWIKPGRPARALPGTTEDFIRSIASVLAPGGRFLCYALAPIQPRDPAMSLPYSDVRFPVTREEIEASGLSVLAFDADDTLQLQRVMRVTGFKEPAVRPDGMPSMTSSYTLLVKPETE